MHCRLLRIHEPEEPSSPVQRSNIRRKNQKDNVVKGPSLLCIVRVPQHCSGRPLGTRRRNIRRGSLDRRQRGDDAAMERQRRRNRHGMVSRRRGRAGRRRSALRIRKSGRETPDNIPPVPSARSPSSIAMSRQTEVTATSPFDLRYGDPPGTCGHRVHHGHKTGEGESGGGHAEHSRPTVKLDRVVENGYQWITEREGDS